MIWFLLTFLGIYGAMHILVYWGTRPLLNTVPGLPAMLCLWMVLMSVAPIAVRIFDRNGFTDVARGLAWAAYSWMGLLFLAFCLLLPILCWDLTISSLHRLRLAVSLPVLHGPVSAAAIVVLSLIAGMYGFYEAAHLRVEQRSLLSSKLPSGSAPIRLVQISDLHLGLLRQERSLTPVIEILQHLRPDLLVVTGDMVDAQMDHLNGLSNLWRRLDPPLGKFAVIGNHEVYAGLEQSLAFLRRSGFTVLRGTAVPVGRHLWLAGEDDPATGPPRRPPEGPDRRFRILLKHRPVATADSSATFDLQLSGHTHRGQMFPFTLLTQLAYPLQSGLYRLPGGGLLYASRGTGTWGPPMRIGATPEITLFELRPASLSPSAPERHGHAFEEPLQQP